MSSDQVVNVKNAIKQCIVLLDAIPGSRPLSLVRTKLEEACMWSDYELRMSGIQPTPDTQTTQQDDAAGELPPLAAAPAQPAQAPAQALTLPTNAVAGAQNL